MMIPTRILRSAKRNGLVADSLFHSHNSYLPFKSFFTSSKDWTHPTFPLRCCYSISSKSQWANRQATDTFVKKRIKQNLRSRAAFKLEEIQSKFRLLKPGQFVLDLGAAPGGWSQMAARSVYGVDYETRFSVLDSTKEDTEFIDEAAEENRERRKRKSPEGLIIAVDLIEIPPIPGVVTFQGDIHSPEIQSSILETIRQRQQKPTGKQATSSNSVKPMFDVILSDMAHSFSGNRSMDVPAVHNLCVTALRLALQPSMLKTGGKLVVKCLQGDGEQTIMNAFEDAFSTVKRFRPRACRPESTEFYIVGIGLKPNARNHSGSSVI